jgi:BirA family transcriptional regulator, biotin operon repressor / biotin---[acetyl-CoA-carboxylase] ligase
MSEQSIVELLGTLWLGRNWLHLPECASTNDEAAQWAKGGAPHGAVVVADTQTAGRGRQGRQWHAAAGESLCFSLVLRPTLPVRDLPPITLAVGIAVAETITRFAATPTLKWPNDVLIDGKKVAGILTETSSQGERADHVIVGIGVNLNVSAFPAELASIATSLHSHRKRPVDRMHFTAVLCERLENWYERFLADGPTAIKTAWSRYGGKDGET